MKLGILYVVPTPIGNLSDITLRSLEALKKVEYIACEDTRHTQKLLTHFKIQGKHLISYHSHSGKSKTGKIVEILKSGNDVALVSDAGTPGISDPGSKLVSEALEKEIKIIPLPGPTALIPALAASGLHTHHFEFFGFLPHKKGRQKLLGFIAEREHTVVVYESKHRIQKFLQEASKYFPKRKIVLARELTKIHEEFLHGTASELLSLLTQYPEKTKGEFTVVIGGQ